MKYILIICVITLLTSCGETYMERQDRLLQEKVIPIGGYQSFFYCKDSVTNLCYAIATSKTSGGYLVNALACVPCDSLKNVVVKTIRQE